MKKTFFTGLIIFLPLAITVGALVFIVNLLTKPFMGVMAKILSYTHITEWSMRFISSQQLNRYMSQILILIGIILFCFLVGFIGRWFFFRTLLRIGDKILHRIPLLNKVYKTSQDIVSNLISAEKKAFKQVVIVSFPSEDIYSLGLVTSDAPRICNEAVNKDQVTVFIPTTPNPTSGYLLLYDKKDLIEIDMKPEDAIKYIVSCAVITPKTKESQ